MEKEVNIKEILIVSLLTIFTGVLAFLIENETFNVFFGIKNELYGLIALSVLYVVFNYKVLFDCFKKYFDLDDLKRLFLFFGEIFLVLLIIMIGFLVDLILISFVLGIFFLFSGIMRVLIQNTSALFEYNLEKFLKIIKIFAYTRSSYYTIGLILILVSFDLDLFFYTILLAIFYSWMIFNLSPYLGKQRRLKDVIKIIRDLKKKKILKLSHIKEKYNLPQDYVDKLIYNWKNNDLITLRRNKIELSEYMKDIK